MSWFNILFWLAQYVLQKFETVKFLVIKVKTVICESWLTIEYLLKRDKDFSPKVQSLK